MIMKESKRFKVRLIVSVPIIFLGITILTANLVYFLTMYYVRNSIPLNMRYMLDSISLFHLKMWVVLLALFSFLCGYLLIYTIIRPIQKLINRAEDMNCYLNSSNLNNDGEIEYFYSIFDEVLSLLKCNLKEREMRIANPLLNRLKRADQLAVLGFIADRIAHEFRNPLGCIQGLAELMKKNIKDGDSQKAYLDTILQSIKSMDKMVAELIEFSKPCTDICEFRDINQMLREVINEVQREFSHKGITVREEFQGDLPPVKTNPQKIHKAFLNILRNMMQFADDGEEIHVNTLGKPPGFVSMGYISIHFSNRRSYITNDDISTIFLPFSVIKKQKIGLGLSIAQHIITAHNGDIWVESNQIYGTNFIVELPASKHVSPVCKRGEMVLPHGNKR
jgi:signal transduction histidine kinase